MVERFFRDITTERLRRGVFTSVPELVAAIDEYIAHHNTNPKPFVWTKSARDILQKVIRADSRLSSKQNDALHYLDQAHRVLSEVKRPGEIWVSEVILHPRITFDSDLEVSAEVVARVHELADEHCFIARSIKAKITVRSASER